MANVKRSRGRGRKPGNQANRSYESNGPDVKIRGNASHISEKYQQLARDAAASGDRIAAENYLQHAEHYYRLVLAAQQQNQPNDQRQPGGNGEDARASGDDGNANGGNNNAGNGAANGNGGNAEEGGQPRRRSRRRPREQVNEVEASDSEGESKPAAESSETKQGDETLAETA